MNPTLPPPSFLGSVMIFAGFFNWNGPLQWKLSINVFVFRTCGPLVVTCGSVSILLVCDELIPRLNGHSHETTLCMLRPIVTLSTLSHIVVSNQNVFIGLSLVFLCDGVAFLSVSDNTTQVYWHQRPPDHSYSTLPQSTWSEWTHGHWHCPSNIVTHSHFLSL